MRFPLLAACALSILSIAATCASAAVPKPRVGSLDLHAVPLVHRFLPGAQAPLSTQSVCRLGQFGDPVGTIGDETSGGTVFYGEGDTYWTFLELRPDSCPGCGTNKRGSLSTAHLALYFPFAPETVTVNVSVVGTVPVPCHYPNYQDPGAIMCAPFSATLDSQDNLTVVDFAIPIPPGCQISTPPDGTGNGFLGFEFVSASDATTFHKPLLAVQAAARVCNSFNPVGEVVFDMVPTYLVGNPVMYAEVASCVSTVDVASMPGAGPSLALGAPTPNPSFGRVALKLSQPREGAVDVSVYDARGARVRSLYTGVAAAGERAIEWNGEDRFGRTAPAGVYYVRAFSGAGTAVQRVLRIR